MQPQMSSRRVAILLVASAFFATAPLGRAADLATADASPAAALSAIHIDNFGQINPTYFRGSQPKGQDYQALAAAGVKTIVNLESDDADPSEPVMAKAAGLHYVQIAMNTRIVPTPAQIAKFLAIVNDPAQQPVYVHCVGGRHRTGVMTAIYRMTHDGWTGARAFAEMKKFKFGLTMFHPEYHDFVLAYHPSPIAAATGTGSGGETPRVH